MNYINSIMITPNYWRYNIQPIKFRGKRIDNGKWAYGYLIFMNNKIAYIADMGIVKFDDDEKIKKYILNIEEPYNLGEMYKVIPETVSQFIGLKDKKRDELYVGDIIKNDFGHKDVIRFGKHDIGCNDYEYPFYVYGFHVRDEVLYNDMINGEVEKIGNVFDNPELLKKETNNEQ